jgi:hypothetical protein
MRWAFTTTVTPVNRREQVVMVLKSQYPDLIRTDAIIANCEIAGFSRIVNEEALPKHDYGRVIQAMIANDSRSKIVFRYLSNPTRDVLEETSAVSEGSETEESAPLEEPQPQLPQLNPWQTISRFTGQAKASREKMAEKLGLKRPAPPPEAAPKVTRKAAILQAARDNFHLLILVDADETVKFFGEQDLQFTKDFIKSDCNSFIKFRFLAALDRSPQFSSLLTLDDRFDLLQLACQFAPSEVLPMLKSSQAIPLDDALPICSQYRVIDACIHIHTRRGDVQSAVNLVAEELEAVLADAVRQNDSFNVVSLDLVKDEPALAKAYETLMIAFELLAKTPERGGLLESVWKNIFRAFQLPLWLSGEKREAGIKRSMTLFFAFFVVESLSRTKVETVYNILRRDFCPIDPIQYREALAAAFKYLDYNAMLSKTVISLLKEDCVDLHERATLTKTRAAFVYNTNCANCSMPIRGTGGMGALVFQCGHTYHDNATCGKNQKTCPRCRNRQRSGKEEVTAPGESVRARNTKMRLLSRVEFGLRSRYGIDEDIGESGACIFFLSDAPVDVRQEAVLQVQEELTWPSQDLLFLER